jgi:hypothetical protein
LGQRAKNDARKRRSIGVVVLLADHDDPERVEDVEADQDL